MKSILSGFFLLFLVLDINAKIIYTDPVQSSNYVSINNCIIIGFDEKIIGTDFSSLLTVSGTKSGMHSGKFIVTSDQQRLIFKPDQPFAFDEEVAVKLNQLKTILPADNKIDYSFHTQVNKLGRDKIKNELDDYEYTVDDSFGNSGNYSSLPQLSVSFSNNPSPGNIYLNNYPNASYTSHIIIADNDGSIQYSREFNPRVEDFNRQPNGLMIYYNYSAGKYYAENSQFNIVDSFYCGNGYYTDGHELRILNNKHALLMSYDPQIVNMSLIYPGGRGDATVVGLIIQEIDENKNVVFQWRSWDHFNILDAMGINFTGSYIDYVHGNAIEYDSDGNLMISSRHLNEITKINRTNGNIIWRMGGVHNQFTFVNDTLPFRYQHNIRRIANGHITLYDNGNFRTPLISRALEYQLNEVNKIATLVWQYTNPANTYGAFMGSVQRLKNGNTLIGWGGTNPTFTEVTPAGAIALQMSLPQNIWSYRAFKDEVNLTLNLKLVTEGFYNAQNNNLNISDTFKVYVRNLNSPYAIVDSSKSVVDSTSFTGNFRFFNLIPGTYFISVRHRNGLETWSKAEGETFTSGAFYNYDFTTSGSQAYGNNLIQKGSKYCIYSGDVDQDGNIDATDLIKIYNDLKNLVSGYVKTDITGDYFLDIEDLIIGYNNANHVVSKQTP